MSFKTEFLQAVHRVGQRISRNHLLLTGIFVALALLASLATLLSRPDRQADFEGAQRVFQGRDFSRTPFGLMDAYDACVMETQDSLGAALLRNQILPLSTRYDPGKEEYFIVLSADVGTVQAWNEATIYCNIDPVEEKVSYYKEVHEGQGNILSRTMSALGAMMNK